MDSYFYIYKVTCLVNNKFYIGQHTTKNLNDGYMGSGKIKKLSIKKYGRENHFFEIVEFLESKDSLKKRESEIINEEMLSNESCMNIQLGGGGGFSSVEHALKARRSGGKKSIGIVRDIHFKKLKDDIDYYNKWLKSQIESHSGTKNGFYGKKHNEQTIEHLCLVRKGKGVGNKNSQFGTCWISHETLGTRKVKKEEVKLYLETGWVKGRKFKFN